jgi:folate-binding protein YgfZ
MTELALHDFHATLQARFSEVRGMEVIDHYGDPLQEHSALRHTVGVLDLSFRGRLALTGQDRVRLLNGQVTNNVKDLPVGQGCYAALVTNKGRMESDLNIYMLPDEVLLDFEPGLDQNLTERFNRYIIADDVQVVDVAPHYGLLSVQGPRAEELLASVEPTLSLPSAELQWTRINHPSWGEVYCMNNRRVVLPGFDLFVPTQSLAAALARLLDAARSIDGRGCGWRALEIARIEAGIPRFGAEMDETNLPPETNIEARAVDYAKGCYIGQEIIARIRTYGQVAKAIRGLSLDGTLTTLPEKGDKLFAGDKEVGYVSNAVRSPTLRENIALGYVRREHNRIGNELRVKTKSGESTVRIVELPFVRPGSDAVRPVLP